MERWRAKPWGLEQILAIAKLEDIVTLPVPVSDEPAYVDNLLSDLVTITGDIVFANTVGFTRVYGTIETLKLDGESQGEFDGMSKLNSIEFLHPGSKGEMLGFDQYTQNGNFIILVREMDGQTRMLGHRGYPAKRVSGGVATTGAASADRRGNTFNFQSARKGPAPIFMGTVKLSDDSVQDPFTGVITPGV
ncbi:hypothetical protein V6R21_17680 [Limibacter armeniacum]|uniref:hypothetical protein n=1 Tax=Limibacter armeniacum TaxID=466084 RepID=UPI002FE6960C